MQVQGARLPASIFNDGRCSNGYSFIDCNCKKGKANFVNDVGAPKFVSF